MKAAIAPGFTGLYIATPCYGGMVRQEYCMSMVRTFSALQKAGVPAEITQTGNDSLVQRARNNLVAQFMASDKSHLLFIDADIEWQPENVAHLLTLPHDLVVGAYRKKNPYRKEYALNWFEDAGTHLNQCPDCGCVEIPEGPAGWMYISRVAIEKMMAAYPELKYSQRVKNPFAADLSEWTYALFDCLQTADGYWGEDFVFCKRWRAIGGQVWLDTTAKLGHWGPICFDGDIASILGSDAAGVTRAPWADAMEVEGWLSEDQARILYAAAAATPKDAILVEIGSWKGRSTTVLGAAVKGTARRLVCVDTWDGTPDEPEHREARGAGDEIFAQWRANVDRLGLPEQSLVALRQDAAAEAPSVPDGSVGFLFVDADHSTEATIAAYRAWEGKLAPGATVIFHDHNWTTVAIAIKQMGLDVEVRSDMAILHIPADSESLRAAK